jgi:hypothetical protein
MTLEDISPEGWLTREVFAHYGLALYAAQLLEHGLINLVLYTGIHDGSYQTWDAAEAADADLLKRTMGKLRDALVSRRPDVAHLEGMLARAVRLRNFLAHEYFRERSGAFTTEDGKKKMIEELEQAAAFFREVDGKLEPLTRQLIEAMGLDKHIPEAMGEVRRAGFGRPLPGL